MSVFIHERLADIGASFALIRMFGVLINGLLKVRETKQNLSQATQLRLDVTSSPVAAKMLQNELKAKYGADYTEKRYCLKRSLIRRFGPREPDQIIPAFDSKHTDAVLCIFDCCFAMIRGSTFDRAKVS
ncbi:hypothetical protein ACFLZY_00590 [Patescibacteria group bacterium]